MKDFSIKTILLGSFGMMVIGLFVIVVFGHTAIGHSFFAIEKIKKVDELIDRETNVEKSIISAVQSSFFYIEKRDKQKLDTFLQKTNEAIKEIDYIEHNITDKDIILDLNKIESKLKDLNKTIHSSTISLNDIQTEQS